MSAIERPEFDRAAQLSAAQRSAATAKGNRNRLAQRVISDMSAMWEEQGDAMLKRAAFHDPVRTLGLFVSIIPQRIEHVADTQGMSDERYAELLDSVQAAIEAKKAERGAPPAVGQGAGFAIEGGGGPPAVAMRGEVEGPIPAAPLPAERQLVLSGETGDLGATPVPAAIETTYTELPLEEEVDPASLF